jgi:hypothetical protein
MLLQLLGMTVKAQQIVAVSDTLTLQIMSNQIKLKNLIIGSSFSLKINNEIIDNYSLDPVNGLLIIDESLSIGDSVIVRYCRLTKPIPLRVGSILMDYPHIDSLSSYISSFEKRSNSVVSQSGLDNKSTVFSSGTVYRDLALSTSGGTEFGGGLQLQLQGKLGDEIQINGILSDQSVPIQPEGDTRSLDEIDKIYLNVSHPNFSITAGDIDFNIKSGKFFNINRKLIGLKNNININNWSVDAIYANSKGSYHKMQFKGSEGNQGPYPLTSREGNRDIQILAGSERVWLDGSVLIRGENHDYTIDYNSAEISFTPKNLINFDSEIFVEYQYSDFQYGDFLLGGSLNREFGDGSNVRISLIRESDQFQSENSGFSKDILDSLKQAGDSTVVFTNARRDLEGDYIFENGIYVFDDEKENLERDRYTVIFQFDPNGSYSRKINETGQVYYEFVNAEMKKASFEYFSPFRTIINPERIDSGQLAGEMKINDKTALQYDLTISNNDKNIYSNIHDDDNNGYGYQFQLFGTELPFHTNSTWNYTLLHWKRSQEFQELQYEREVLFNREWNYADDPLGNETLSSAELSILDPDFGTIQLSSSQHMSKYLGLRNRISGKVATTISEFPSLQASYNRVYGNGNVFEQFSAQIKAYKSAVQPVLTMKSERNAGIDRFDQWGVGISAKNRQHQLQAQLGRRIDRERSEERGSSFSTVSDGIFGEIDYTGNLSNGWKGQLTYRKRVLDRRDQQIKQNFQLARIRLSFRNTLRPLRYDLQSKLEETSTQTRAVVFDSVGPGLGQYRFDSFFNEYVLDENGAYVSFTVPTGERRPTTNLTAMQRVEFEGGRLNRKLLKHLSGKVELRTEFKGSLLTFENIVNPSISATTILRSKTGVRTDINFRPPKNISLFHLWTTETRELNGLDPRGNTSSKIGEKGLEVQWPITLDIHGIIIAKNQHSKVESRFWNLRNRKSEGSWFEGGIKIHANEVWQMDLLLQGGVDNGQHLNNKFSAWATGSKLEILYFIAKSGRLKLAIDWISVRTSENITLPPEAMNGNPAGNSLKGGLQGQILLGTNLSLILRSNYINNDRHRNFFSINGEIRAHF